MTLDEMRTYDREWLTPAQVADVLGCDPQDIRDTARLNPGLLGFPVIIIKGRTKIPRRAFIRHMEGVEG